MEYLIKASVILGIFYFCYKLFLQKETFFNANRWYLLIGLFIAAILPSIVIPIYVEHTTFVLSDNIISETIAAEETDHSISLLQIATWIYSLGFIFFLGKLIIEFTSLFTLISNKKKTKKDDYIFIETTNNLPPFSFFNWIVYNPNQFEHQELVHIINHEKVHAKEFHSIDVILSQLNCVVFWFNPLSWLYKKELQQNLEFIADNKAQNSSQCEKSYQRLLLKTSIPNHNLIITNNFYNSLIKKRIVMLHKSKSNQLNTWKYVLVLPLLGLFLMSFNTKEVFINSEASNTNSSLILSEVDILITKDFSDAELEGVKNQLSKEGLNVKFKGVKRNASEKIIAIKIDISSKGSSANYHIKGNDPISSIKISYNKAEDHISIGSVSATSSNHNMVFISEDGETHEFNSEKNVFIVKSEDGDEKEIEINIEKDGEMIFISEDGEAKTITRGDETIEIIQLSDDAEVVEIKSDGNTESKKVWVTKTGSKDNKEKAYKVKVISLEDEDNQSETNQTTTKKVITINSKNNSVTHATPLTILDGKEISMEDMESINPESIESVNVLKDETATKKYGDKGKNGVIEITTKK